MNQAQPHSRAGSPMLQSGLPLSKQGAPQSEATSHPKKPSKLPSIKIPRRSSHSTTPKETTFQPVKNVPTGGISTKQRLTQAALAAVKPKAVSAIEVTALKKGS